MLQRLFLLVLLPVAVGFSQNFNWTQKVLPTSPSARTFAALVYDQARAQSLLFGGLVVSSGSSNGTRLNDTWVWDGTNWTQKFPVNAPQPRWQHAMAYDQSRQQTVLFGGFSSTNAYLNDTWVWDGTNWTQKFPTTSPSARVGHAMAYDALHGQVILFSGSPSGVVNDTWVWDGNNWTQRFPVHSPAARIYFAMSYDHIRQQVILFGGNQATLNDTWLWTGSDWVQQILTPAPRGRSEQGMAFDPLSGKVMMYGGLTSLSGGGLQYTNDTLLWDGTNWTQVFPSTAPSPSALSSLIAGDEARSQVVLFSSSPPAGYLPATWVTVAIGTGCIPPMTINPPTERTSLTGITNATVSNIHLDAQNHLVASVQMANSLRWYLEVSSLSSSSSPQCGIAPSFQGDLTKGAPGVVASQGLLVPCTTRLSFFPPFFSCPTAMTPFTVNFDGPGTVDLTLKLTPKSMAVTFLDLFELPGLSPSDLTNVVEDIMNQVPDFFAAITCFTIPGRGGILAAPSCATSAMNALSSNPNELLQIPVVMQKYGVAIGKDFILEKIKAVILDLTVLGGDGLTVDALTGFTATIPIGLKGQ